MQSGKYRHEVTLLRRVDTQQSGGQVAHSYEPFATVWARISPVSGREFFAAAQVQSEVTTRISIRWRDDVDETCRVRHVTDHSVSPQKYDEYDIKSALPDEKTGRRELVLMCSKGPAEGWRG
jgi:SPP1 family predicted phage head-tail adaptor